MSLFVDEEAGPTVGPRPIDAPLGDLNGDTEPDGCAQENPGSPAAFACHRRGRVEQTEVRNVELVLPADLGFIRLARLVASGVASGAGLDVDDVADFRIAVDELSATLMETTDSDVVLVFSVGPDGLRVSGSTTSVETRAPDPDRMALARQILDVVADDYEYTTDDGRPLFRLRKRITSPLRHGA